MTSVVLLLVVFFLDLFNNVHLTIVSVWCAGSQFEEISFSFSCSADAAISWAALGYCGEFLAFQPAISQYFCLKCVKLIVQNSISPEEAACSV
jgi:hypothetical protein